MRFKRSLFILGFFSLVIFLVMLFFALHKDPLPFDSLVNQKINSSLFGDKILLFFTNLGDTVALAILSSLLFIYLFFRKRKNDLFLLVLGLGGGFFLRTVIKLLVHRARPENALLEASEFSFPSGHAVMSIIFFSLLIYFFKDKIKNKLVKYSFISINILIFLLIGFSRIYFGVHWLSDVLGGFALGGFWLSSVILFFERNDEYKAKI